MPWLLPVNLPFRQIENLSSLQHRHLTAAQHVTRVGFTKIT